MFPSVVLANYTYQTLGNIAPLVAITPQDQMSGAMVVPQGMPLPAILFYMTYSEHSGPVTSSTSMFTNGATLRYEVKAIDKGDSDATIYPVAKAFYAALTGEGANVMHEFDEQNWSITFTDLGEIPLNTLVDRDNIYRQLGTVFNVDIFRV